MAPRLFEAALPIWPLADLLQQEIGRDGQARDRALEQPVVGHVAQSTPPSLADFEPLDRRSLEQDAPGGRGPLAGKGFDELLLAIAVDPGNSQDLASRDLEADRPDVSPGVVHSKVHHFQNRPHFRRTARSVRSAIRWHNSGARSQRGPEHQPHDLGGNRRFVPPLQPLRCDLANLAAAAQDRDAVAIGEGLVQLVRDEDDREAARRRAGASGRRVPPRPLA